MPPRAARTLVLLALLAPFAARADLPFTTTNTDDGGAGSLRQAILDANATPGADTIVFDIPAELCSAAGVCRIEPLSALPTITETVTIDATTQPRFGTAPANVCATQTAPSYLRVEVVTGATNGFEIAEGTVAPVVLRGLSVHAATRGIYVRGAGAHRIQCNHVNVNGPGDALLPATTVGVGLSVESDGAVVGTDGDGIGDAAERNVIGGATWGLYVNANDDAAIAGNYFCVAADGTTPLSSEMIGVLLRQSSSHNRVGTNEDLVSDELEGNLFAGCLLGVTVDREGDLEAPTDNLVAGNRFGLAGAGNLAGVLAVDAASLLVRMNRFTANDTAIQMIGDGTLAVGSEQNCLEDDDLGFLQDGSAALMFENNWWGAADGPSGLGAGSGDAIQVTGAGSVDYEPFLTAPPEHCVVPEPDAVALSACALLGLAGLRKARRA